VAGQKQKSHLWGAKEFYFFEVDGKKLKLEALGCRVGNTEGPLPTFRNI